MDIDRKTAFAVLLDVEKNEAFSNLALNRRIKENQPQNPAFVRELVYGVLKYQLLLDYQLDKLVKSGSKKLKKQDLTLLRMGLYQLTFMDAVPEYAAVSETVQLAKKYARGRENFINAVLRNFIRGGRKLQLPERAADLVTHLSVAYSTTPWVVRLWLAAYGEAQTEQLLAASNQTPALCVRVNPLRTTVPQLTQELQRAGFTVTRAPHAARALLVRGSGLLATEAYLRGCFSVQDEASILVADAVGAKPGETVIDVCAAPGGKTLAMAEQMENRGEVLAMDLYEHKLALIEARARSEGVSIMRVLCRDSRECLDDCVGRADCVLADVPCSGLGVFRRKPEIKYKQIDELSVLVEIQKQILAAAAAYVKPGGTLVYSTCTIHPAENEMQTAAFLSAHEEFTKIEEQQFLPQMGMDGLYYCKMRRAKQG